MTSRSDFRRRIKSAITSVQQTSIAQSDLHLGRYVLILELIQKIASPDLKVIDIASSGQILPALRQVIGLTDITTTNAGDKVLDDVLNLPATKAGTVYSCPYHHFDIEQAFPYPDKHFDLVILTEVLEHITRDPMHTMSEINRITKTGGWLLLETPNCASLRSVLSTLRGQHPQLWSQYSTVGHRDRHNREYTPTEVSNILIDAGYRVDTLVTADDSYTAVPSSLNKRIAKWCANQALALISVATGHYVSPRMRGEATFALAQKNGPVKQRFPGFLYAEY